jgi:hypothetical protein
MHWWQWHDNIQQRENGSADRKDLSVRGWQRASEAQLLDATPGACRIHGLSAIPAS